MNSEESECRPCLLAGISKHVLYDSFNIVILTIRVIKGA